MWTFLTILILFVNLIGLMMLLALLRKGGRGAFLFLVGIGLLIVAPYWFGAIALCVVPYKLLKWADRKLEAKRQDEEEGEDSDPDEVERYKR